MPDRNPATDPQVGDTWTRGKAALQVTSIRDDVVTLTPSGPEIASTPTTWRLHPRPGSVGWAGSVCSWPGWVFASPAPT